MKKIFYIFALFAAMMIIASCSSDDNNGTAPGYDPTYGTGEAPEVVEVWPADGTLDLDTIDSIIVTYNMPITVTPNNSVRIEATNDDGVTTVSYADSAFAIEGNKMIAYFHTAGNCQYNITLKSPMVHNGTYAFAKEYEFGFTTKVYNNFDPTPFASMATELTNANADEKTKKIFAYLVENFGQKVLSATCADPAWDNTNIEKMYELSGYYPAIHFYDFLHLRWSKPFTGSNWINYMNTTAQEEWTQKGGLIGAQWHWNVPKSQADINNLENYAFYSADVPDFSVKNALKSGKWENKQIVEDLDAMVTIFQNLQSKGISVIFRPLHEASGGWFWWANDGAAQYKKLWKYIYDYFKGKNVNNLIWVWTCQGDDANWYPGNDYVDIVGCDVYNSTGHESRIDMWQQLIDITGGKKLITMSECGYMPSIGNMLMEGDMWSWVMPWNDRLGNEENSQDFLTKFMSSSSVITLEDLPSFNE